MIYTKLTKKALRVCFDAHKEQVDKTGLPYVFHPFHLAEQMDDEISTICALLHDVVEDTPITFEDLLAMGFNEKIIEVLKLLTHEESVPYMDYVRKISTNSVAKKVKIADLKHNSDVTRLEVLNEYDLTRNEKYSKALAILEGEK
ncbi:MAG: bifunctional (p)ppGpp synthetase/guanosine-3',5'-bis(diphosphate) 3'-pyrophosphohydrolase [Clostridia bacterium]|nr:bifunctional (p)ppGpp synthetase/guanosine-3',5'-bis(diphosphate) 3'-pyrophosphohydrolase [Clostridia bacterium]